MGHHYLPRRFLRGFSREGLIWTLDKKSGEDAKRLPVARIAQEPGMYSAQLEDRLNNEIEQPFNSILDRIDVGGTIDVHDIEVISRYVLTMFRRVPAGRARSVAAVPNVTAQLEREQLKRLDMLRQLVPDEHDLAEKGQANITKIFSKIRAEKPEWLWHSTVLPENMPRLTALLKQMTWEHWQAPPDQQFLTCDHPVLFNESKGLADKRAELIFPIRGDAALVASWRPGMQGQFRKISIQQIRQANSMVAMLADRWVFFGKQESWVVPFVRKHSERG